MAICLLDISGWDKSQPVVCLLRGFGMRVFLIMVFVKD